MRCSRGGARALLLLLLVALSASVSGVALPSPAYAQDAPVLSAAEIDYPPFSLVDADGRATGFSVELLDAALAAMGRDVTFRVGSWTDVRGWLESGEVGALPLVGRTPEREALFDFTFPYMTLHGAIVVREGTTGILDFEDLRGRKVGVMKGDNAEEFLRREERGIDIRTTLTFDEALRRLSDGEYDAVVVQRLVALRLIQANGLTDLRILDRPVEDFRQDFCFAVSEGDKDLLEVLNEGLALVIADGTYRHLHAKWFASLQLPTDRRIVVGGDHNYPPFEFLDANGRPAGFNVDLTRAIAQEVGLDVEIRLGPWAEARESLASGEVDILQGMFYSLERDLLFDFSQPHTVSHGVAVVREGEDGPPADLEALRGKSIVVQRGDIMHDFALENGLGGQITAVESPKQALRELAEGRYDCALLTRVTALRVISEAGWDDLVVGKDSLLSSDYCYAVRDGQAALLAQFSEGLTILEENGEYRRIQEKWLGVYGETSTDVLSVLKWVALGVAPILVILLGVLLWMRALRAQVARRTAELQSRESHLAGILRFSADGVFIADPGGRVVRWNPAMEDLTGLAFVDAAGRSILDLWEELVPAVDRDSSAFRDTATMLDSLGGQSDLGGLSGSFEQEILRGDGSRRFVELKVFPVPGDEGFMFGCVARDITERKSTEAALLEAEERYRVLVESTSDAIFSFDSGLRLTGVNRVAARWFGHVSGDIIGMRLEELGLVPSAAEVFTNDLRTVLETGEGLEATIDVVMPDGESHTLEASLSPIRDGEGRVAGVRGYTKDVTEPTRAKRALEIAEEHLRQAQKMEAIGQLAGGIAHDFNNLLTAIIGYSELILAGAAQSDESLEEDVREIRKAAERGSDLTRQILAFSRKQALRPRRVQLNEVIREMESLLQRTLGEEIRIEMDLDEGLPPVEIDEGQIQQAVMNLTLNARDAMPSGGLLRLETGMVELQDDYLRSHPDVVSGEYVTLSVSDTGFGMTAELLKHVFEPFFTTKDVGKGTGLGLSTVLGIVKQSGGTIAVESEPGVGSTFRIYLPTADGMVEPAEDLPDDPVESASGEGRILVVEDDSALRAMVVRTLVDEGYEVLECESLDEVRGILTTDDGTRAGEGSPLDLVLTDVVLPGGAGGREVARAVLDLYPDVAVIFMSGYPRSLVAEGGRLDPGIDYLEKPFTPSALRSRVRAALQ